MLFGILRRKQYKQDINLFNVLMADHNVQYRTEQDLKWNHCRYDPHIRLIGVGLVLSVVYNTEPNSECMAYQHWAFFFSPGALLSLFVTTKESPEDPH